MRNKTLGKGLSALLAANNSYNDENIESLNDNHNQTFIDVTRLKPSQYQPRKKFDDNALTELANSIKSKGVILPLIIREIEEGYEIIAGERRWRAAKLAHLDKVPVIIKQLTDKEALEFALLENIQRENLTPIEEAESYQRLIEEFSYTQEALSKQVSKSRSHIANLLRLLNLPHEIKGYLHDGKITIGHAKVLVGHEKAIELAEEVLTNELSVRDLENIVSGKKTVNDITTKKEKSSSTPKFSSKDEEIINIENGLTEHLGLKILIEDSSAGGKVIIHFHNLEQLDKIIQKLSD
ncbi:MAG: ParB/RepB/Spo0J family partition protein [Sphingobacteriia bacterium]|nr:ParB/RepB/Spo0J family partition protein [Sphingobacteriia bacterium]